MVCGGCSRKNRVSARIAKNDLNGGIKYLTRKQIAARLEIYKKKYCKACEYKSVCDYEMYSMCPNGKVKV